MNNRLCIDINTCTITACCYCHVADGPKAPDHPELQNQGFGSIGESTSLAFYVVSNPAPLATGCTRQDIIHPVKVNHASYTDLYVFYMNIAEVRSEDYDRNFSCVVTNNIGDSVTLHARLFQPSKWKSSIYSEGYILKGMHFIPSRLMDNSGGGGSNLTI